MSSEAVTRAIKMLSIASKYIDDNCDLDETIFYDQADCDGYCVVEDCVVAAEELSRLLVPIIVDFD